jgi:hypothetical protein
VSQKLIPTTSMSLGTSPWHTVGDKSAFPSSSVQEHKGGANFRRIPRAHQQRSSPRPDSREIAKWFGESAADKSDAGRPSKGVCFGSAVKSESEVRHQSRNNTVRPHKNILNDLRFDWTHRRTSQFLSLRIRANGKSSMQNRLELVTAFDDGRKWR